MANVPRSARGAAHSCRDRIRLRRCAQAAIALATEEAGGNIGADHRFDTHSPVVPRAGGRLHDLDDAQVARHDMDRPLPRARRGATRATLTRLCVKRKLRGPPRTTARVVPVRGSGSLESPGGVWISGHRSVVVRLDPALAPQRRRSQRHRSVNGRAARDARAANGAGRCEGWTGRGRDSPERYDRRRPWPVGLHFAAKRSRQRECPTARRRPQTAGARSRVPSPNG